MIEDYIESRLGYPLPIEKGNSFENLGDIPNYILNEVLKVGKLYGEEVLKFYTTQQNWDYLKLFIEKVVYNGQSPQDWAKREYLIPDISLNNLLVKSRDELLPYAINYDLVLQPQYKKWEAGSPNVGSPLIYLPGANYLTKIPKNSLFIRDPEIFKLPSENAKSSSFKRWIAQRIARHLYSIKSLNTFQSFKHLEHLALWISWTEDAKKAFNGLLRERNEIGWKEGEIPGFVGPDEFYI